MTQKAVNPNSIATPLKVAPPGQNNVPPSVRDTDAGPEKSTPQIHPAEWVRPAPCDFFRKLVTPPEPNRRLGMRSKMPLVPAPELTIDELTHQTLTFCDINLQFNSPGTALANWVQANLIEFALRCTLPGVAPMPKDADVSDYHRIEMTGMPGYAGHRAYLEPSFILAKEREMTELQLNQKLRELTGLSVREWWDAVRVRYTDVRAKVRDDLDATLRAWAAQQGVALPKSGEELLTLLRRFRKATGFSRQVFALDLGFKNHARLSRAFRLVTRMTLAEWERALLDELALVYAREAAQHRAASQVSLRAKPTAKAGAMTAAGPTAAEHGRTEREHWLQTAAASGTTATASKLMPQAGLTASQGTSQPEGFAYAI
jgi:AraC-like DNA-binding protein